MSRVISVFVNGKEQIFNSLNKDTLVVREVDSILIKIIPDVASVFFPEIYIEDYKCEVDFHEVDGENFYSIPESKYFSESFGFSSVRIEFEDEREIISFDVHAKKTSVDQARRMISYLASHSESLIKSCFSRSTISVGAKRDSFVDPEALLSTAEIFIETLQTFQMELLNNLRERLIPIRVPLWETNMVNAEIDPYDVINNLDALTPSGSEGDVFLRGRNFSLDGIYVSSVQPTADVIENQILLGGLYSLRRQISKLLEDMEEFDISNSGVYGDYESFSRLLLSLTAGGMILRCKRLLGSIDGFLKLLERKLAIKYKGEISPIMTPYVRSTRVYRMLFTQLNEWYELGSPSLSGIKFLMKLKSLSKIYEIFVVFHTVEELCKQGWTIESAIRHSTMGEYVPSKVFFRNGNDTLTLEYEPVVGVWTSDTSHMELIDVGHSTGSENPYWTPDIVLRLDINGTVRYIILDAKYSTRSSVKQYHIPALFEKYFVAIAAYDAINKISTHVPIVGVFAVFSLDENIPTYISKWGRHGIYHSVPRVPMIGGIGLMTENADFFSKSLGTALGILRKTLPIKASGAVSFASYH